MEVRHVEQFSAAFLQPGGPLAAAALRAVAVAAGVIAVIDQPAAPAAADLSSQCLGTTRRQLGQGPPHAGGGVRILPVQVVGEAADDGSQGQLGGTGGWGVGCGSLSRGLTTRARPVVVTWV